MYDFLRRLIGGDLRGRLYEVNEKLECRRFDCQRWQLAPSSLSLGSQLAAALSLPTVTGV